ncbi:MAG: plasmid mobilization protein [Acidobacteriaceae bacterium]
MCPQSKIQSRRCPLKPPLRTKSVGTKVSEAEFAMLEERAQAAGLTLSEWVREVLLAAPMDGAGETGEVILAEVLALRTLFLNLQFRQGQGPMTEAEMRTLIERADTVKGERARERIEAARKAVSKADEKEAGEPQVEEV